MEELDTIDLCALIMRIQAGDRNAYTSVVQRFQDMAVGYAYSILGDMHLAEEAAQEAFIDAYFALTALREPAAFPGWFRRIVHTKIHRLHRDKRRQARSLEQIAQTSAAAPDPADVFARYEQQERILAAIAALPETQRQVVTLFYISGYSQNEIGAFLEIPVSTVKMRLHYARKRLKEKMITMIQDNLYRQRPSRNDTFQQDLQAMLEVVKQRPARRVGDYPTLIDLQELFGVPETQANTRLWERADGQLLGFAIVDPRYSTLDFDFASYQDHAAIFTEMVAWATEVFHAAGLDAIRIHSRDDNQERIKLLAQLGFVTEPVGTLHLRRSLALEIPAPQLPAGFTIRHVAGEHEVEQLVETHRAAFGTENMTVAYRLAMMHVPEYDPQLDLVAVASDGTLAAFCFGYISQAENRLSRQQVGWLDPVGTRPEFRRRGLARALMLTGLALFKQRGMASAATGMSEENIAMQRTAEAVGFEVAASTIWFSKQI